MLHHECLIGLCSQDGNRVFFVELAFLELFEYFLVGNFEGLVKIV